MRPEWFALLAIAGALIAAVVASVGIPPAIPFCIWGAFVVGAYLHNAWKSGI